MFNVTEYFTKNDISFLNKWSDGHCLEIVKLIQKITHTDENFIYNGFGDMTDVIVKRAKNKEISIWFMESFTLSNTELSYDVENTLDQSLSDNPTYAQIEFIRKVEGNFNKIYLYGCDYGNIDTKSSIMEYNTFDNWLVWIWIDINLKLKNNHFENNRNFIDTVNSEFNIICLNKVGRYHRRLITSYLFNTENTLVSLINKENNLDQLDTHSLYNNSFLIQNYKTLLSTNTNYDESTIELIDLDKFMNLVQKGLLSIVTESRFHYPNANISEKLILTMLCGRLLLPVSSPNSIKYLRTLGFECNIGIDYSYDVITNHEYRLYSIFNEIDKIKRKSKNEMIELYHANKEILQHNSNFTFSDQFIYNMKKIGNLI